MYDWKNKLKLTVESSTQDPYISEHNKIRIRTWLKNHNFVKIFFFPKTALKEQKQYISSVLVVISTSYNKKSQQKQFFGINLGCNIEK